MAVGEAMGHDISSKLLSVIKKIKSEIEVSAMINKRYRKTLSISVLLTFQNM